MWASSHRDASRRKSIPGRTLRTCIRDQKSHIGRTAAFRYGTSRLIGPLIHPAMFPLVLLTAILALLAGALPASAQGKAPDAPDRPTGTAIFVGGVDLEWNVVPGADSYDVQLYRNGQWIDLPGNGVEIAFYGAGAIISELDPHSTLWFQVRARNAHGSSDWSEYNQMNATSEFSRGRQPRPGNVPASGVPDISGDGAKSERRSQRVRLALGTKTVSTECNSGFNGCPMTELRTRTSRVRQTPRTPSWQPTRARPSRSGLPLPIEPGTQSR